MSQTLSDHIRACLDRAVLAERLASRETDPVAKTELLELASGWRQCAVSYEYVEKLENFMQTFKAPDGPQSAH
jgi:hypothetical protein